MAPDAPLGTVRIKKKIAFLLSWLLDFSNISTIGTDLVSLKSTKVESEQQRLQDLNQEHTQNLLVSDYFTCMNLVQVWPWGVVPSPLATIIWVMGRSVAWISNDYYFVKKHVSLQINKTKAISLAISDYNEFELFIPLKRHIIVCVPMWKRTFIP